MRSYETFPSYLEDLVWTGLVQKDQVWFTIYGPRPIWLMIDYLYPALLNDKTSLAVVDALGEMSSCHVLNPMDIYALKRKTWSSCRRPWQPRKQSGSLLSPTQRVDSFSD